jgi:hypothetical protein
MHKHMALGNLAGRRDTEKLDKEVFSGAPVEAMQHALVFLKCVFASLHWHADIGWEPAAANMTAVPCRQRYGSVAAYIEHCGLSSADQAQLKLLLVKQ